MSVPPQGPDWARPDQPARPAQPGGPVPPAPPRGQQRPPADAADPAGPGRFTPSGGAGTERRPMPQWPGGGAPAPGGEQGQEQQLLGDEAVEKAAEAVRRHAANRIIDTSSGRDDGLNKCPRCGSAEIQYSLTAKALVCAYCRHTWNVGSSRVDLQACKLEYSIVSPK